ncbi:MAG: NAD(P)/FAD-dependent oxidoreductase [Blastococcus sp.]
MAGLQAAVTLGRACRRVVLFDDGQPRNAPAAHVHNYLGVPDAEPAGLVATGRRMLSQYDVEVVDRRVVAAGRAEPDDRTVLATADGRRWSARAVVLATGLRDELPDVPGVADLWGRDVVACPHCHGWEVRGLPLAQLGIPGMAGRGVQRAELLSRWSSDVVLLTDGDDVSAELRDRLDTAGVTVCTEPVRRLIHSGGRLESVETASGQRIARSAVFVVTRQHQQSDLALQLGCVLVTDGPTAGAVRTDPTGATSVPGIWAAGTTAVPALLAVGAAGHASTVAVAVHAALLEQDLTVGR